MRLQTTGDKIQFLDFSQERPHVILLTGVPMELRGWGGVEGVSHCPFFNTAALWRKGIECHFFNRASFLYQMETLSIEWLSGASLTWEITLDYPFWPLTVTPTLSHRCLKADSLPRLCTVILSHLTEHLAHRKVHRKLSCIQLNAGING